MGDRARDSLLTIEQLESRRQQMRKLLLDSIGGLPRADTPLCPETTGISYHTEYRMEHVLFQSMPNHYVTAHLYIPHTRTDPDGAVLFVCGHGVEGALYPNYQHVCQCLVRAGLVVLAIDPIGQGERFGYFDPDAERPYTRLAGEHEYAGAQCWPLGDGLARYFIHDIIRSVDYLSSRPEVDPLKIGITGNSGGGTQTALAIICEPRIAAAAPGTFIMNRESYLFAGQAQDAEQIWPGMSAHGFDHEDILLAMAPRPLMVLAVTGDIFPIEGTRRTVERCRRFWELFGRGDELELVEDVAVHKYTLPLAQAAAAFFSRHLLGQTCRIDLKDLSAHTGRDMWCTRSGNVYRDYPQALKVYHENQERLSVLEQIRGIVPEEEQEQQATRWLWDRICGNRTRCDMNPRHQQLGTWEGLTVQSSIWWSQPGLFSHGFLFRSVRTRPERHSLTVAIWEGGTSQLQSHQQWLLERCRRGDAVLVLDLAGAGALEPNPINGKGMRDTFGTIHKLNLDLFWLDDSLAAIRAYDILRALEFARGLAFADPERVTVYAEASFSFYAELAAALDTGPKLELVHPRTSVAEWVRTEYYRKNADNEFILPGMLRRFDLPDLRVWRQRRAASISPYEMELKEAME